MLAKLCPKCNSPNVRRSRRRTLGEFMAVFVFRRPYRCRICRHRFLEFEFAQRVQWREEPREPWHGAEEEKPAQKEKTEEAPVAKR